MTQLQYSWLRVSVVNRVHNAATSQDQQRQGVNVQEAFASMARGQPGLVSVRKRYIDMRPKCLVKDVYLQETASQSQSTLP